MAGLPQINFPAVWAGLSAEQQAFIGTLAIERSFLLFAGGEYQGDEPGTGVCYLDKEERAEALDASEIALDELTGAIEAALPRLFGENPSPAHPFGTDPAWATPMPCEPSHREAG